MNIEYIYYNLKSRALANRQFALSENERLTRYAGRTFLTTKQYHEQLAGRIAQGNPLLAARFGTTELSCMKAFEFNLKRTLDGNMMVMQKNSGFFPPERWGGEKFLALMKACMPEVDFLGTQFVRCEAYFINKYFSKDCLMVRMKSLEPFCNPENPWTQALAHRKVLVIHPFAETIASQYQKYEHLFPDVAFLPRFDLITYQAVQTLGGKGDTDFRDWFEALDFMTNNIRQLDFDIAIVGCGAYGFPLAARIKGMGKQAIHLGGATQALFGIKCKRFDEAPDYGYIRRWYSENWVYPSAEETPAAGKFVEGGCYWKPDSGGTV